MLISYKNASFRFRWPLLNPWSRGLDYFYYLWMRFFGLQNLWCYSLPLYSFEEPEYFNSL